jgi:hypothetical protein
MRRLAVTFGLTLLLSLGLLSCTASRGGLARFSPFTLEYQTQAEWTVLWGRVSLYRTGFHASTNELLAFGVAKGYVSPVPEEGQRWEPLFHWNDAWKDGFGPLYDVLIRDRREIIAWSQANREAATLYWSSGFRYLRGDNPRDVWAGQTIFSCGWRCRSVDELRERIAAIEKEAAETFP